MRALEVSTVVDSILTAFGNATDVFRRMKGEKPGKKMRKALVAVEESRLQLSLTDGPLQIKSQYDSNVAIHGTRFSVGDAHTQTNLARVLFELNDGLMAIVSSLLDRTPKSTVLAKQNLSNLTFRATEDTLSAFRALNLRLSSPVSGRHHSSKCSNGIKAQKGRKRNGNAVIKSPVITASSDANPLLARGGWIRTKSGDSIAISAREARQRATQKIDRKRKRPLKSISNYKGGVQPSNNSATGVLSTPNPSEKAHFCKNLSDVKRFENCTQEGAINLGLPDQDRPPSLYIVPAELLHLKDTTSERVPSRPTAVPLHSRPHIVPRLRPVSGMTFATESTKMGEIPEHKVPDLPISEEELRHRPLPYLIPPPLLSQEKTARKGFWRFRMKKRGPS